MRKIVLFLLCVTMMKWSFAQDPHFSQFYSSPLTLSPAFTGKFDGTFRMAGNYRNQWPTINRAYQTATVSADFHIMQEALDFRDTWGVGVMAYTDKSAAGAVNFNYLSLSTAFHKGLDEDGFKQIGLGFQATYSNMMINTSKLFFEDQLTSSGFTGVTMESFSGQSLKNSYWDLNAGVLYTASTNDRNNFYLGVSMYHITRPKQSFTGAYYVLDPRTTLHGGGYIPFGEGNTLHFSGLYSTQAGASETVFGGAAQLPVGDMTVDKPTSVYIGAWMRMNDAIIPYVGLEYNDFRLGVTYDVNTSSLKTASNSRGGIEISLIYIKRPEGSKGLPCPKF
ncbi:PorP/SprF family type IX secretion system membrane protein [Foetidibacter luteolus]|uniref:PorP/SprF family type IX secretion system membrane protein n=1 Tax=Foetidibacter luteolus TaxID=2608880 RepID=UPI00129A1E3C|nr:PorP/SprF family type IX secretion system membrane protein [Foetidibacter luteolus]